MKTEKATLKPKKPKLARLWMVWPMGAKEWTITQSTALVEHANRQGWSVIEFKEVRS